MNKICLVIGAGVIVASSSVPSIADQAAINDVIGRTWSFEQGKAKGTIHYGKNTVEAKMNGKTYKGSLRISGDEICTKYPALRDGKESCFGVSKSKGGYKTNNGGRLWK